MAVAFTFGTERGTEKMGRHALAIDLGGTKIAAAVVRDDGTVIAHATRPTEA